MGGVNALQELENTGWLHHFIGYEVSKERLHRHYAKQAGKEELRFIKNYCDSNERHIMPNAADTEAVFKTCYLHWHNTRVLWWRNSLCSLCCCHCPDSVLYGIVMSSCKTAHDCSLKSKGAKPTETIESPFCWTHCWPREFGDYRKSLEGFCNPLKRSYESNLCEGRVKTKGLPETSRQLLLKTCLCIYPWHWLTRMGSSL